MAKEKQALGKGLDILFSGSEPEEQAAAPVKKDTATLRQGDSILFVDINKIKTNPYQPREDFEEVSLKELADSIKQKGIIQAITIRKTGGDNYELLSGERRIRAAKMAGLVKIPAFILDVNDKADLLEISLIENIQRKDLNPLEVAKGYQRLITECKLTQEQVSEKVCKSRTAVTNFLRLLKLPEEIKQSISKGEISEGHARAILAVEGELGKITLWKKIIGENLTVRRAEEAAKTIKSKPKEKKIFAVSSQDKAEINFLEEKFREHFGTKVKIKPKTKTAGEIVIEYYTPEDLERIVELCRKR